MSFIHDQKGIGHIVLPLLVLAVLVIGFSGYEVMHANKAAAPTSSTTTAATTAVPTTIKTESDLQQAATALNSSSSQMQTQLSSTSLDSSINQML